MFPLLQLTLAQKVVLLVSVPVTGMLLYLLLWKRDQDDDDIPDSSDIVTSRQTVIEVKVPRDAVGAVIGPQGSNIKEIQEVCGARVQFKDVVSPDTVERTVVIRGSHDSAQQAELLIRKIIEDQPEIITESIMVPDRALGRIIGRSGETVRQMSHQSKAKIIIDRSHDKRQDGMKEILLRGTSAAVSTAKTLIEEKVKEHQIIQEKLSKKAAAKQSEDVPSELVESVTSPVKDATEQLSAGGSSEVINLLSETSDHLQAFVSAVEHPGHFWIQILDSNSKQLDKLIKDMTAYYSQNDDLQASQMSDLKLDDIVAAPFVTDSNWYRARVVGISDDVIDLYYVDFGDSEHLPRDKIRPLRSEFLSLPHQALECKLAGIKPTDGEDWSEEAVDVFEELVYCARWKVLMVKAVSYETTSAGSTVPCLEIIDTNKEQDFNIAEELVNQGYAMFEKSSCRNDKDSAKTAKVAAVDFGSSELHAL